MTLFFAVILLVLGKDYLVSAGMLGEGKSFLFYILIPHWPLRFTCQS